jgi:pimeloyl-ACP methyl ester carboxylesterase
MSVLADNASVRPFPFPVASPEEVQGLRDRVAAARWPDAETVPDHSQGVRLETIQKLASYWATDYNWRSCEQRLKALSHFKTENDGLNVHFIHVRSQHDDALPLILTHGWPGSVIELLNVIGPLTDPTAYGGTAADAFHVVIPSMPGYGYSDKPCARLGP